MNTKLKAIFLADELGLKPRQVTLLVGLFSHRSNIDTLELIISLDIWVLAQKNLVKYNAFTGHYELTQLGAAIAMYFWRWERGEDALYPNADILHVAIEDRKAYNADT